MNLTALFEKYETSKYGGMVDNDGEWVLQALLDLRDLHHALEFYAHEDNWPNPEMQIGNYSGTPIHNDFGDLARKTINKGADGQ